MQEEMESIKKELEDLRRIIGVGRPLGGMQRSYSYAVKKKKKRKCHYY